MSGGDPQPTEARGCAQRASTCRPRPSCRPSWAQAVPAAAELRPQAAVRAPALPVEVALVARLGMVAALGVAAVASRRGVVATGSPSSVAVRAEANRAVWTAAARHSAGYLLTEAAW